MMHGSVVCESDRFIDPKSHLEHVSAAYSTFQVPFANYEQSPYSDMIRRNLFETAKSSQSESTQCSTNLSLKGQNYNIQNFDFSHEQQTKNISPTKMLNMPNLRDDFYLKVLDWHKDGPIGIALDKKIYLYTPTEVALLSECDPTHYVSSLKFNDYVLSVGVSDGSVQFYDLQKNCKFRKIHNHSMRVSALQFCENLIISGSKDCLINYNDLRVKESLVQSFQAHNGEVCSLKVKPDQPNFFASGSNDHRVKIWDMRSYQPLKVLKGHKGAIKAMSWCPWKANTLATGGGSNDKTIKVWGDNMDLLSSTQTNGHVSGIQWNSRRRQLISSHGASCNEIGFWKYEQGGLAKVANSRSYKGRFLSLIQSKEEDMVCGICSDETLKLFELPGVHQNELFTSASNCDNFSFEIGRCI